MAEERVTAHLESLQGEVAQYSFTYAYEGDAVLGHMRLDLSSPGLSCWFEDEHAESELVDRACNLAVRLASEILDQHEESGAYPVDASLNGDAS